MTEPGLQPNSDQKLVEYRARFDPRNTFSDTFCTVNALARMVLDLQKRVEELEKRVTNTGSNE